MDFIAYHDRTSADHQAHFNQLFLQGYRMISLSVYGARQDERYAAVWVRRAGPDWSAVHGVDGAGYQAAFDRAAAAGLQAGTPVGGRTRQRSGVRRHVRAHDTRHSADSLRPEERRRERSLDHRALDSRSPPQ